MPRLVPITRNINANRDGKRILIVHGDSAASWDILDSHSCIGEADVPLFDQIILSVDPASEGNKVHNTGIVCSGVANGTLHVLDGELDTYDYSSLANMVTAMYLRWGFTDLVVEDNHLGSVLLRSWSKPRVNPDMLHSDLPRRHSVRPTQSKRMREHLASESSTTKSMILVGDQSRFRTWLNSDRIEYQDLKDSFAQTILFVNPEQQETILAKQIFEVHNEAFLGDRTLRAGYVALDAHTNRWLVISVTGHIVRTRKTRDFAVAELTS